MSTQTIRRTNARDLMIAVDKAIVCIADKYVLETYFDIKNKSNKLDLQSLIFYKGLLNRRYCKEELPADILENINNIVVKYN